MGNTIRRIASDILGAGESRVWIDPAGGERVRDALTRDDVRALIKDGIVKALPIHGVSRLRAREKQEGRRKGRHRGKGSRRGTHAARSNPKEEWMAKVRLQRRTIADLRDKKQIEGQAFQKVYLMVKGGAFRGKAALMTYLKENKLIKQG